MGVREPRLSEWLSVRPWAHSQAWMQLSQGPRKGLIRVCSEPRVLLLFSRKAEASNADLKLKLSFTKLCSHFYYWPSRDHWQKLGVPDPGELEMGILFTKSEL